MSSAQFSRILSLPPNIRTLTFSRAIRHAELLQFAASPGVKCFSSIQRIRHAENTTEVPASQSSVNQSEVLHFNALAAQWWDPYGSSRLLHLMNPLRHKFIRKCLSSHIGDYDTNLRFLDVGCGGGIFAESAARLARTKSVTAIDPSPEVISVARRHQRHDPLLLESGRLEYQNTAIENLPKSPSPAEGYDIVTLFEVIEHIRNPSPFLESCLEHLRPGGWLIGSTIARTNVSWFTTKVMAEDVLRIVPRGTHEWSQYIQPKELREWARVQPDLRTDALGWQCMGVVYVPGLGWREVAGTEQWGNYFFGVRKRLEEE